MTGIANYQESTLGKAFVPWQVMDSHKPALRTFGSAAFPVQSVPIRARRNSAASLRPAGEARCQQRRAPDVAAPGLLCPTQNQRHGFHALLLSANCNSLAATILHLCASFHYKNTYSFKLPVIWKLQMSKSHSL